MKITARTLFLVAAVFLNSIELLSSMYRTTTMTLAELFPGDNGGLPPIEVFNNVDDESIQPLYSYSNVHMDNPPKQDFLKRGDVVVAWRRYDYYQGVNLIEPLCKLIVSSHLPIVYHIALGRWVYVHPGFEKLGFGHVFELLHAREQAAATTRIAMNRPDLSHAAHDYAYREANSLMDSFENDLAEQLRWSRTTTGDGIASIRHKYTLDYTTLFSQFVRQNGHRYHPH